MAIRMPLAIAFGVLAGAAAVMAHDGAQEKTPFKSGASTVAVYTTVTDAAGRLVPDLGRESFEVYDNGKLQAITTFTADVQPITLVMMLDRSLSMLSNFRLVEQAAGALVDRLLPGDKARIGSFSDRIQLDPRDFTADKDAMRVILKTELQSAGPTPLWNAVGVAMTALLHQQGRRVVLIFTDGMDRPLNGSAHNVSFKDVVKRAEQEDVMVYGIGLAGGAPFGRGGYGGHGGYGGRGMGGYGPGGGGGAVDKPDPGLAKLAGASGGGYFELTGTRDLSGTFARVVDELHRQYLIGFVPQKLDGKVHKLEVRVKGDGLSARARKSYVAAR
jgi:VWFA-related protein